MTLGESIRDLRKQHNLSQEQLAEKLGVSRQSVSLWEKDATQPTIDNIITLSDIFGVTIDELLKSNEPLDINEEMTVGSGDPDALPEKRNNAKRFIIAALDLAVLAVGIYMIWFCATGTEDFINVLDLHFNAAAVMFIETSPIIIGAITALFLLTGILSFAKNKTYNVLKTVLIILGLVMFAAVNITGGAVDNRREKNAVENIPAGVSYFDIRAFEDIKTSPEYDEEYVEGQTDGEIPVNYSVKQNYFGNSTYTRCVEFSDSADKNSELSRYYIELETRNNENLTYLTDAECAELNAEKCAYHIDGYHGDLSVYVIKGNRVYYCTYTNIKKINITVMEQIRNLK